MLVELRSKSQITIPKEVIHSLGLSEGDKFELIEKDNTITLIPVTVYPKEYINKLHDEINTLKTRVNSNQQPLFDSIDSLIQRLEKK